ncbi:MAG: hypothetical protein K2M95_07665 [Clostridiales bacterium]|nr:hypothetical protein [Clostridiales bacterium]
MKKGLCIAANVCAIVLMGIMCLGSLVAISMFSDLGMSYEVGLSMVQGILVGLLIFCIATIIISALALAKGVKGKAVGLTITTIVLIGIVAILEFLGDGIVYGVLCLIPVGLDIAYLCVKTTNEPVKENVVPETETKQPTVEGKISELNALKEKGLLSQEQYDSAVSKIIDNMK